MAGRELPSDMSVRFLRPRPRFYPARGRGGAHFPDGLRYIADTAALSGVPRFRRRIENLPISISPRWAEASGADFAESEEALTATGVL